MILLLLALLIVALLVTRQIGAPQPAPGPDKTAGNQPPTVPSRPQDVRQFSEDMDRFMLDADQRRRRQIEQQTR